MTTLEESKNDFIAEWGALGPAWGMTRSVARVHALLMVSEGALTTDDIMEALSISRGGAHGALKELTSLGIAKSAVHRGERRESFVGEKDPWKVFSAILRERKRREVEPVLAMLDRCLHDSKTLKGKPALAFKSQLANLQEFVQTGDQVMDVIASSKEGKVLKWMISLAAKKRG